MRKNLTPVQRLMAAMDECAIARGEANWTNGYRTGKGGAAEHLYDKERAQWQKCDEVERKFRNLAARLLRRPTPRTDG